MTVFRLLLVVLLPPLIVGSVLPPDASPLDRAGALPGSSILGDGEYLVYEVSWTLFKLGTIRVTTKNNFTAEAFIDSYENIPFVDLHTVHTTTMDSSFYSRGCWSIDKNETEWRGLEYVYDFPARRLVVQEIVRKDPFMSPTRRTPKDTISLPDTNLIDGLSIAYFPRQFVHTNRTVEVPTILYENMGTTTFFFTGKKTTKSIDALEDPVHVVEVGGTTTLEGIYGMTGDFRGWFSDDSAAVPIKGRLKVLIGEVDVELIQWNRKGWNPPTK